MQTNLGVLGLMSIAVIALLPRTQVLVHLVETTLAVENAESTLELELILGYHDATTVVADAAQRFENDVDESLMIHRPGKVDMTKMAGITLVVQVSHTRIVGATVHRLTIDLRFIPSNTRRDLTAVDRQSLSHRILTLLIQKEYDTTKRIIQSNQNVIPQPKQAKFHIHISIQKSNRGKHTAAIQQRERR